MPKQKIGAPSSATESEMREDVAELLELLDAVGEGRAGKTRFRLDTDEKEECRLLVDELALRDIIGAIYGINMQEGSEQRNRAR